MPLRLFAYLSRSPSLLLFSPFLHRPTSRSQSNPSRLGFSTALSLFVLLFFIIIFLGNDRVFSCIPSSRKPRVQPSCTAARSCHQLPSSDLRLPFHLISSSSPRRKSCRLSPRSSTLLYPIFDKPTPSTRRRPNPKRSFRIAPTIAQSSFGPTTIELLLLCAFDKRRCLSLYLSQLNHSSSLSNTTCTSSSCLLSYKPDCKHRASSAAHIRGLPLY